LRGAGQPQGVAPTHAIKSRRGRPPCLPILFLLPARNQRAPTLFGKLSSAKSCQAFSGPVYFPTLPEASGRSGRLSFARFRGKATLGNHVRYDHRTPRTASLPTPNARRAPLPTCQPIRRTVGSTRRVRQSECLQNAGRRGWRPFPKPRR